MEDKTLRYTLFALASVVGIWKGRNENRCFCVRFCFSFVIISVLEDRSAL